MAANTHSADLERSEGDYLYCADSTSLSITGNITVEAWIKLESLASSVPQNYAVVGKWDTGANIASWLLYFASDDTLNFIVSADGTNFEQKGIAVAVHAIAAGTWYHVAASWEASTKEFKHYKNGTQLGSTQTGASVGALYDGNQQTIIGVWEQGGGIVGDYCFDGLIDEVKIFNTIRTEAQIKKDMYNSSTSSALKAYWQLNNALTDSSGNGNTLTNSGAAFSTTVPFANYVPEAGFLAFL